MKTLRLDDAAQTVVACAGPKGLPELVYWGAPLPEAEDLEALVAAGRPDVTGGMMDAIAPVSVCPDVAQGWPGQPGLMLRDGQGRVVHPRFEPGLELRGDALILTGVADGLRYEAEVALRDGCLQVQARLEMQVPHVVEWLCAPVLPVPQDSDGGIDYAGRWIGEFQENRFEWRPGVHLREARQGRSGHEHPPFALITTPGTALDRGETYGYALAFPGGHRMSAEELPDGRRVLMFGATMGAAEAPVTAYQTPVLTAVYTDQGRNGVARAFQRLIRKAKGPARARQPRPVHYNCWEAIYFDHDEAVLRDIAARAADLGAERFVLDDGWFGRRDDDTTSLGDWQIDPRKWPNGLRPFAEHVNSLGMGFGLWFEPEMINKDSDLYRAHPEWLLGTADQPAGRQQYVLDMARGDVRAYLFEQISDVLHAAPVEYVKWDHNRLLPSPSEAQAEGALALWRALSEAFPEVEFESCASGGGRIDLAMFAHAGRVWLSDSNDAVERMRIQQGAAQFLPWEVTGSHVGPRHCHTSGRVIEMETRAWVAAQRHMGFEMDPRELTEAEAATLRRITKWWKDTRHWRAGADILRLDSGDPELAAEIQVSSDGHRFVAFAGRMGASAQILPRPLRLTGLDPKAVYEITLLNRGSALPLSRGSMALKEGSLRLSGAALMGRGVTLPWAFPASIWVLEGRKTAQGGQP